MDTERSDTRPCPRCGFKLWPNGHLLPDFVRSLALGDVALAAEHGRQAPVSVKPKEAGIEVARQGMLQMR